MKLLGPADTLKCQHRSSSSSSNTRLFPVEMSRARKSSETICPERFCGPTQHSKGPADKGAVGSGGVFREKQQGRKEKGSVAEKRSWRNRRRFEWRRWEKIEKKQKQTHIVSNGAKTKPRRTDKSVRRGEGGGGCQQSETDPKRIEAARATETSCGQEEAQHLIAPPCRQARTRNLSAAIEQVHWGITEQLQSLN